MTVLAEADRASTKFEILFQHRGGDFYLWIRDITENQTQYTWTSPLLSYTWQEVDGPLAMDPLIMHVGTYCHIDVPYLRICSYDSSQSKFLPIMPSFRNKFLEFPSSGQLDIGGNIVSYGRKTGTANIPRGPFTARNNGIWEAYGNPSSGLSFGGTSIEITDFDWSGATNWSGYVIASDQGYSWEISSIDWRVIITTNGQVVWLKNRARVFTTDAPSSQVVSTDDRAWLTQAFGNLTVIKGSMDMYGYNTLVYLDSQNQIVLKNFQASNGEKDIVIRDIIQSVCQIIGARTQFPGDRNENNRQITVIPMRIL